MSFFKKLFAKVAPQADLTQLDEKAESDFNEAFATLVNEQVSAATNDFQTRLKALEDKETPSLDGFAKQDAIATLEGKLTEANASIEALSTKATALAEALANKGAAAPKAQENTNIAIPNKAENTSSKFGFQ